MVMHKNINKFGHMTIDFKMASLIERIARLSLQTFQRLHDKAFNENFNSLKQLVKQVMPSDLNFDISLVQNTEKYRPETGQPPVTYISICENDAFSMGIFILKTGVSLPLHDHPGMFGICRVINGSIIVKSYSVTADNLDILQSNVDVELSKWQKHILVIKRPDLIIGDTNEPCVLTPVEGNYHQIFSKDGPSAFLDILAPPYDHQKRECHYYREILGVKLETNRICLVEIPSPAEYWCDVAPYQGPSINLK